MTCSVTRSVLGFVRLSLLASVVCLATGGSARAQVPPPVAVAPAAQTAPASDPPLPLRLALQLEAATGVATGSFHNQLVGGRVDVRFSPQISLGGYLGYANLKGKDGRAHSALTYAQLEYLAGNPSATVRYPLRFASGYLGGNGPVVRVAGGFAIALTPKIDLVPEVAPMVWFTNNQTLLSVNVSLELSVRL